MRILWLCNIILPSIAMKLNLKPSNKEGWLSGICDAVKRNHDFELGICFPVSKANDGFFCEEDGISYFGFYEDTVHPEKYDENLEVRLGKILSKYQPNLVHIFGTEYPHTLAMCRCLSGVPEKLLIGIQGILDIYKDHYYDGVPEDVYMRSTFRDIVKRDSILAQRKKFCLRALNEVEAVRIAGNITGRTPFDKKFTEDTNPKANYYHMNETLRNTFYEGKWDYDTCEKHSLFLSQGNYPIKGLHTALKAVSSLKYKYPDIKVYVAGDKITAMKTFKDKLKISSYGKYILELISMYKLESVVSFTGSLDAEGIKKQLLKSETFLCPSSIENSPNSLGEAMLLGVPCISSDVGGVRGIFEEGEDGLLFANTDYEGLARTIDKMWSNEGSMLEFSRNASRHAAITHNPETNYSRLLEIYRGITKCV